MEIIKVGDRVNWVHGSLVVLKDGIVQEITGNDASVVFPMVSGNQVARTVSLAQLRPSRSLQQDPPSS